MVSWLRGSFAPAVTSPASDDGHVRNNAQPWDWSHPFIGAPQPNPDVDQLGAAAGVRGGTQLAAVAEGVEETAVASGAWVAAGYLVSQTGFVQPYAATWGAWLASFRI